MPFCPVCHAEFKERFAECSDCGVALVERLPQPAATDHESGSDLDVLIVTGLKDPIAIGLAQSLLSEAGVPFFNMDTSTAARQESGNWLGWWSIRVPHSKEAEAREILESIESA